MMITQEKTLETGQERRAMVTFLKPVCKIPSTQLRLRPAPTEDQSEQRDSIYLQLKQCNLKKGNTFIYLAHVELVVFLFKAKMT